MTQAQKLRARVLKLYGGGHCPERAEQQCTLAVKWVKESAVLFSYHPGSYELYDEASFGCEDGSVLCLWLGYENGYDADSGYVLRANAFKCGA